jgi:predicted small metal-binding protein
MRATLLIDGVEYKLWTPQKENELEEKVKEHAKDIFGEGSI